MDRLSQASQETLRPWLESYTVTAARPGPTIPASPSIILFPSPLCPPPRGDFSPTDTRFFREMKHGVPQQPIRFGLITTTIGFEPRNDVGIQTHSYGFLPWPIELADFRSAPIENWGRIGKI